MPSWRVCLRKTRLHSSHLQMMKFWCIGSAKGVQCLASGLAVNPSVEARARRSPGRPLDRCPASPCPWGARAPTSCRLTVPEVRYPYPGLGLWILLIVPKKRAGQPDPFHQSPVVLEAESCFYTNSTWAVNDQTRTPGGFRSNGTAVSQVGAFVGYVIHEHYQVPFFVDDTSTQVQR